MGSRFLRRLVVLAVAAAACVGVGVPAAAHAAAPFRPCPERSGVECATVVVPLDRSGALPGTVPLHVERQRAPNQRGVMLLIAGGPGQASAAVFDLEDSEEFEELFPGYTLVAFDPRGTGKSGALRCRSLLGALAGQVDGAAAVAACGRALGERRRFFTTREHADDIEAVRQAIGADKIGLWGTSYGTKLALAYARAYPTHVERLLLDSVLPLEGPDPFRHETLRGIPRAVQSLCVARACRGGRAGIARDVVTLANRLARTPLRGRLHRTPGMPARVTLAAPEFLGLVVDADVHPALAAELPWAVGAAVVGQPRPLLRLAALRRTAIGLPDADEFSPALLLATLCGDGPFPWDDQTPLGNRVAAWEQALAARPPEERGGFEPWAARTSYAWMCRTWPNGPTPAAADVALPDVPVLALAGDRDMRTPVSNAEAVVARFRQGRLLVVPGVGHSVLGADATGCSTRAVRAWMAGRATPTRCRKVPPLVTPVSHDALATRGTRRLSRAETLRAVSSTVADAQSALVFALTGSGVRIPGVYGGYLQPGEFVRLRRYSVVPGVTVDGGLEVDFRASSLGLTGRVVVCGPRAARMLVHARAKGLTPRPLLDASRACGSARR